MTKFPLVFRVRQKFHDPWLDNVPGEVEAQLSRLSLHNKIKSGETVAITAGSRGIANIQHIIKAVADHLKGVGANPFIVPAMGSHGGGARGSPVENFSARRREEGQFLSVTSVR